MILDPEADDAWRGVAAEDTEDISAAVGAASCRPGPAGCSLAGPPAPLVGAAGRGRRGDQRARLPGRAARSSPTASTPRSPRWSPATPARWSSPPWPTWAPASPTRRARRCSSGCPRKVAQAVLLDLRGRVFTHSQALSLSFHEKYTSGRVISRMTSDLDALGDLAAEGLEGLISGLLSVVAISVTLLVLDLRARPDRAGRVHPDPAGHPVVPAPVAADLPAHPVGDRVGHRAVHRDDERAAGRAVVPPGGAEPGDLRRASTTRTPGPTATALVALADLHADGPAVRQPQPGRHDGASAPSR